MKTFEVVNQGELKRGEAPLLFFPPFIGNIKVFARSRATKQTIKIKIKIASPLARNDTQVSRRGGLEGVRLIDSLKLLFS